MQIIIYKLSIVFLLILCVHNQCEPFGRRIQYEKDITSDLSTDKFTIGFNTLEPCATTYVALIYKDKFQFFNCSTTQISTSSAMNFFTTFIHTCLISNVDYDQTLYYNIVNENKVVKQWVELVVTDPRVDQDKNVLVFADWGLIQNGKMQAIHDHIFQIMKTTRIDLIMINGDIAYDLDSEKGQRYTGFLRMMDNLTARIPVVMLPGNHQHFTNDTISLFNSTFQLYNIYQKAASGFSFGKFYFLLFDPYFKVYSKPQEISSLQALKTQLKKGKLTSKYIIPCSHYPLTCSSEWLYCQQRLTRMYPYFDAMLDYGVSLYIGAHTHSYERTYPYYGNQTFQLMEPPYYHNQNYLISIIEGVAGNNISIMQVMEQLQNYTASYTINQTGFGLLKSQTNAIRYSHYSTQQGFMDELIINLNTTTENILTE